LPGGSRENSQVSKVSGAGSSNSKALGTANIAHGAARQGPPSSGEVVHTVGSNQKSYNGDGSAAGININPINTHTSH